MVTEETTFMMVTGAVLLFGVLIIITYWILCAIEWVQKIKNKRR